MLARQPPFNECTSSLRAACPGSAYNLRYFARHSSLDPSRPGVKGEHHLVLASLILCRCNVYMEVHRGPIRVPCPNRPLTLDHCTESGGGPGQSTRVIIRPASQLNSAFADSRRPLVRPCSVIRGSSICEFESLDSWLALCERGAVPFSKWRHWLPLGRPAVRTRNLEEFDFKQSVFQLSHPYLHHLRAVN